MSRKIKDMAKEDENWKAFIRAEDDSGDIWRNNWGFLVNEYAELKKKLDEKTSQSIFLSGVKETEIKDDRQLRPIPESTNHTYGWVASQEEFRLEKYGPDIFKGLPLQEIYRLRKH